MTPKEKALELVKSFKYDKNGFFMMLKRDAILCSLTFVDGIIEEVRDYCDDNHMSDRMNFWIGVRNELEKL